MSISTRWPVLVAFELEPNEIDADGHATDTAIARVVAGARDVYIEGCETLRDKTVKVLRTELRRGDARVRPDGVTIATGVVEIFPEAFVMNARIRGRADGDIVADTACTLTTGGPLPTACRDEFIARAHNARHSF
jgi:hypothetical protein